MIYLYLFGTCFHFIYVFMIIGKYTILPNNHPIILSLFSKIQCIIKDIPQKHTK